MRLPSFASAFRRRLGVGPFTPAALAAMAWNPSYRAPSAADLHDEDAYQPPGPDAPLEAWGAKDFVVRDGVVVGCSMSGRAFLSLGRCELSEVRLVAVQPFIAELARCPHLAKLMRLDLRGSRIGLSGVKELAASPFLGRLHELVLSGNNVDDAALTILVRASWFENLRVLDLSRNDIGDTGILALASCPDLARLRELDLTGTQLGSAGANSLVESIHLSQLCRVIVGENIGLPAEAVAKLRERYNEGERGREPSDPESGG